MLASSLELSALSVFLYSCVRLASARESSKSGSCSLLLIGVSVGAAVDSSIIGFSVLEVVKRGLGLGTMVPSGASSSEGLVNQGPLLPATEGDQVWNPYSPDSTATSMIGPGLRRDLVRKGTLFYPDHVPRTPSWEDQSGRGLSAKP